MKNIFIFICVSQDWTIFTANRCINVCKREFHSIYFGFFHGIVILLFHIPHAFMLSLYFASLLLYFFFLALSWMFNICIWLRELVGWTEYFDDWHSSSSVTKDMEFKSSIYHHWCSILLRSFHCSHVVLHLIILLIFNSTARLL